MLASSRRRLRVRGGLPLAARRVVSCCRLSPGGEDALVADCCQAGEPERARSDHRFPDLGQQLGWSLSWEHTTVLAEDARGELGTDIVAISRDDAGQLAARLAIRYWTPEAAHLPWIQHAYPQ